MIHSGDPGHVRLALSADSSVISCDTRVSKSSGRRWCNDAAQAQQAKRRWALNLCQWLGRARLHAGPPRWNRATFVGERAAERKPSSEAGLAEGAEVGGPSPAPSPTEKVFTMQFVTRATNPHPQHSPSRKTSLPPSERIPGPWGAAGPAPPVPPLCPMDPRPLHPTSASPPSRARSPLGPGPIRAARSATKAL